MRIVIVEDDPLIKAALHAGLGSLGIDVLASTTSSKDALSLTFMHHPDVVLLDLDLGDGPTGLGTKLYARASQSRYLLRRDYENQRTILEIFFPINRSTTSLA